MTEGQWIEDLKGQIMVQHKEEPSQNSGQIKNK